MRMSDWSSDVFSSDLLRWCASTAEGADDRGGPAVVLEHGGQQVRGGRLAAGAGDADDGDAPRGAAPEGRCEGAHGPAHGGDLQLGHRHVDRPRSEEHTSELQSLMRISYAVFRLKKKKRTKKPKT